jgi:SAM-dependent methyltransferase
VEYTPNGADLNRRRFEAIGVDSGQVIEADALSEAFLASWQGGFDVVFSMGFVEHFTDPAPVIARHVALCRPGGLVVVTVPNMRGLNLGLTRLFDASLIPLHHLEIMAPDVLSGLFAGASIEPLFCGYYGSMDLGAFTTPHPVRRWGLRALRGVQWGVNRALAATPSDRRFEHRWTSPFLAFVGRRLDEGTTTISK